MHNEKAWDKQTGTNVGIEPSLGTKWLGLGKRNVKMYLKLHVNFL